MEILKQIIGLIIGGGIAFLFLAFVWATVIDFIQKRKMRDESERGIQQLSREIRETTDKKLLATCYAKRAEYYCSLSECYYSVTSPDKLAALRSGLQDCEMAMRLNPDDSPTSFYDQLRSRETFSQGVQAKADREWERTKLIIFVIAIIGAFYWYETTKK